MNKIISEWRINPVADCDCHRDITSKVELSLESLKNEAGRLISRLGCYGGEEITFSISDGIEKAKEFVDAYVSEGLITLEAGREILKKVSSTLTPGIA